jgi:hypothetical protein
MSKDFLKNVIILAKSFFESILLKRLNKSNDLLQYDCYQRVGLSVSRKILKWAIKDWDGKTQTLEKK